MTDKHTSGPWRWNEDVLESLQDGEWSSMELCGDYTEEDKALITAAPDMLAALREVREEGIYIPSPLWVKVNGVITKAEGKSKHAE